MECMWCVNVEQLENYLHLSGCCNFCSSDCIHNWNYCICFNFHLLITVITDIRGILFVLIFTHQNSLIIDIYHHQVF